jgi:hypothetical protein
VPGGFEGFVAQSKAKKVVEAEVHPSGFVAFQPVKPGRYPGPTVATAPGS